MSKLYIILTCAFFLKCTAILAADYRPFLFLDGRALANNLTLLILDSPSARIRRQSIGAVGLIGRLYRGENIRSLNRREFHQLRDWILSQPEGTILPDQLFGEAIQISKGNIQDGLILAWDFLRDGWTNSKNRNYVPQIRKLFDITGEAGRFHGNRITDNPSRLSRTLALQTIRGDNFSAWYHIAGTALLGYTLANGGLFIPAQFFASAAIWVEEKWLHDDFIDGAKRYQFDHEGMRFGVQLATNLRHRNATRELIRSDLQKHSNYLYDAPERLPKSWALQDHEIPSDYQGRCPRQLALLVVRKGLRSAAIASPIWFPMAYRLYEMVVRER